MQNFWDDGLVRKEAQLHGDLSAGIAAIGNWALFYHFEVLGAGKRGKKGDAGHGSTKWQHEKLG